MNLPKGQGKRRIVKVLSTSTTQIPTRYQELMRRTNNCTATSIWGCSVCTIPQIGRCMDKVRQHLQTEAFKQYNQKEEFKKEQERLMFPAT